MRGFGGFGMPFGFIFMILFVGIMSRFGGFGMPFGFIFMIPFFAGIFFLVTRIVKQPAPGGNSTTTSGSNALEVLKERFAKGEISKEELAEMKKELSK